MNIISQTVRVTFDDEDSLRGQNRYFSLNLHFNDELDYVLLRLKENGQVPLGLYHEIASVPLSGPIHIISHPQGEIKHSNAGVVIPQSQQKEE